MSERGISEKWRLMHSGMMDPGSYPSLDARHACKGKVDITVCTTILDGKIACQLNYVPEARHVQNPKSALVIYIRAGNCKERGSRYQISLANGLARDIRRAVEECSGRTLKQKVTEWKQKNRKP